MSSSDTHQISTVEWYYNVDTIKVGSVDTLLILCIDAMQYWDRGDQRMQVYLSSIQHKDLTP